MASLPSQPLMTAEELMELPDDSNQYELDEGRLIVMPPSAFRSSQVASRLGARLGTFILDNDLGIFAGEGGGLKLTSNPDTVRAPDFSFVRRDRVVDTGRGYFPGAPDLAVEVLSPSDRYAAVARKVRQYLATGVRLVWVIDPEERTVTIHRANGDVEILGEDGVLDGEDVVPGFRLPLSAIWV
jgi:Uma2 family endonuclease